MRRKQLSFFGIIVMSLSFMTACRPSEDTEIVVPDRDYFSRKVRFAISHDFENIQTLIPHDLSDRIDQTVSGEHIYTFTFVYDFEKIVNFSDDMVIFFPTEMTLGWIELINYGIRTAEVDVTEFSLIYPLTLEDFVYNWEDVQEIGNRVFQITYFSSRMNFVNISDFSIDYQARRLEELELTEEDERLHHLLRYGQGMWFGHNQDMRFMDMRHEIESGDHSFSDFVFVHSEEEAFNHPDNVIAFFPTEETLIALETLRWFVEQNEGYQIISEELGLNSSLTIEGIINDGEAVSLLWQSIAPWKRADIQRTVLNERAS